ncbi:MAG: 4-hydroxy-3-methylbut-2-enyl diphosphate reductase [Candidatus Aminicenantes bacterium]|nr:4-hydroxy-3-methylbut-2-enyl diphosphate reductase [Candidatus Aminicenantes bacterium]
MKIVLSEFLSYCFGVKRTLKLAEKLLEGKKDQIYYMLGEIVHNENVIADLKKKGLKIIKNPVQIKHNGTVIIQSHGVSQEVIRYLRQNRIPFIDATCPMVKIIHMHIKDLEEAGYYPVVIGKKGHDEVKGIVGQVKEAMIIGDVADVTGDKFQGITRVGIVVQSTFIKEKASKIHEKIQILVPEVKMIDTICKPTLSRQQEISKEAGRYDCVLIIGSKSSANTKHLFHLAKREKNCVYLIDTPERIRAITLPLQASVFVASGASTPGYLIDEIVSLLKKKDGHSVGVK